MNGGRNRTRRAAPRDIAGVLERARRDEAEQQHWQAVVDEAAALHGFDYSAEGWQDMADWYANVPARAPSRGEQARWLREQRVLASWRDDLSEAS